MLYHTKIQSLPTSSRVNFIYLSRCKITKDGFALSAVSQEGKTTIPISSSVCLMLGHGTTITHQGISLCADEGVSIFFVGDNCVKLYCFGFPARPADLLMKQVRLFNEDRMGTAKRLYAEMFDTPMPDKRSINQLRGIEGNRVKDIYKKLSLKYNVPWTSRNYQRADSPNNGGHDDDINTAINITSHILNNIVEAVISSLGLSPSIGFIHHGNNRSFVFDIADTIKFEFAIEVAFSLVGERISKGYTASLEKSVRTSMGGHIVGGNIPSKLVGIILRVINESET